MSAADLSTHGLIEAACATISKQLIGTRYAFVGGAACRLLGSDRTTNDVDIVVLRGEVPAARARIAESSEFTVEPRTRYTWFKGQTHVPIDILSPPMMFRSVFDADTPTVKVERNGVSAVVLHPIALLNAKCQSIHERPVLKKYNDYDDIVFLLRWLAVHSIIPTADQVPNASDGNGIYLMNTFGYQDAWITAGYDCEKGRLFPAGSS